jgi:hypothetical protein
MEKEMAKVKASTKKMKSTKKDKEAMDISSIVGAKA